MPRKRRTHIRVNGHSTIGRHDRFRSLSPHATGSAPRRITMNKAVTIGLTLAAGVAAGVAGTQWLKPAEAQPQATPASFSAVSGAGAIGAEDISGPYEVQQGWPQDLATLPGHEKWTYGSARGIFAESPDRVFLLGGSELPKINRPASRFVAGDAAPNLEFPVGGLPWRNANPAAPPGNGGSRQDPAKGLEAWRGTKAPYRELGTDARWEHAIVVVNREGKIIEEWTQWDHLFKRPHAVYISPYDPEKHVWVVDDH